MKKLTTSALVYLALALHFVLVEKAVSAQGDFDNPPPCSERFLQDSKTTDLCLWSDTNTKLYVIHPTVRTSSSHPPVLYLLGGPGSKGDVHITHMSLIANRLGRIVMLPDLADSVAELECSRTDMDDAQHGIATNSDDAVFYTRELQQARLEACLQQIKITPALQATISTSAQARKLKELRHLLGLESWIVFGESYGGRLAVLLAGVDRAGITELILDSPETPWVTDFWHTGRNFKRSLGVLSELCRDQYRCPAKRLRLEERLPEIISVFDRNDVEPLQLKDFYTRKVVAYARPTQEQLFITTFMALRSAGRAELMPYIAAAPNDEGLKKRFGLLLSELLRPGSSLNMGFHHIIRCGELPLDKWYRALEADKTAAPELSPFLDYLAWRQQFVCGALGIKSPATLPEYTAPTVNTLVLSGGLDPVTPAPVIAGAFPAAPNVTILNYETLGHVVHSQLDCVLDDIRLFVEGNQPTLEATTCKKRDLKMRFFSPVVRR